MIDWQKDRSIGREIQYRPARVLMQDFTGVPRWSTLPRCATRSKLGGDTRRSIRWSRSTWSSTIA